MRVKGVKRRLRQIMQIALSPHLRGERGGMKVSLFFISAEEWKIIRLSLFFSLSLSLSLFLFFSLSLSCFAISQLYRSGVILILRNTCKKLFLAQKYKIAPASCLLDSHGGGKQIDRLRSQNICVNEGPLKDVNKNINIEKKDGYQ